MQKVFHILIALGLAIFGIGSVIFVLGQAVCLIAGMPEMVTMIETTVDAVIFPAIALTGLLSFIYGCIWKKSKKQDCSLRRQLCFPFPGRMRPSCPARFY